MDVKLAFFDSLLQYEIIFTAANEQ